MTSAVFAGFQTLLILNLEEFQGIAHFSWNSGQNSQNLEGIYGFPVMLTNHFLQDFQCPSMGVCRYFLEYPNKNLSFSKV